MMGPLPLALAGALLGAAGPAGFPTGHPGMVFVPAGPFVMGSSEEEARAAFESYGGRPYYYWPEVPRRTLRLGAYWIDRTEVTNAMYAAYVRATGMLPPHSPERWARPYLWVGAAPRRPLASHPVTLVTFEDAQSFCRWRGMNLPMEEEWEKAARGDDGRAYPWGATYDTARVAGADQRSPEPLDRVEAWTRWWRSVYRGRMRGTEVGTFAVGSFPSGASPYGALDMAGNVFEWVDATFDPYPGSTRTHPDFGRGHRVVRGGDWYLDRIYHRAPARLRAPADHRVPTIGFRCVCRVPGDRHMSLPVASTPARANARTPR